jgi:hypothetical protein
MILTKRPTIRRHGRRWLTAYAVATVAAATTALIGITATPAAAADPAGRYDGYYPSSVSGCGTNIRVGSTKSVYDSHGVYYGWMEQRWASAKGTSCYGYQWVRLHLTKSVPVARYYDDSTGKVFLDLWAPSNARNTERVWTTTLLAAGTYNGRMLYAPYDKLTGCLNVKPTIADQYAQTSSWTSLSVCWVA